MHGMFALLLPLILASATAILPEPSAGPWRAWLDSPGGELPFGLELKRSGNERQAWLINPPERATVPRVSVAGGKLILHIDHYDAQITADISADGRRLDGSWRKRGKDGSSTGLPFHAVAGDIDRFLQDPNTRGKYYSRISGRWLIKFSSEEQPAVGIFEAALDGAVTGSILTATGDYGFLAGRFDYPRLRLSNFDGAHAFLFDARLQSDGTLSGDFWSRDTWHETWTATRDDRASLPDGFERISPGRETALADIKLRAPDGREQSLQDAAPTGTVRIVEVFGTWCPNCHDASDYLGELQKNFGERGLRVVGLAFEYDDDFSRSARLVRQFAERHHAPYPMFVAGVAEKEQVLRKLPFLTQLKAYPTIVFIDRKDRVRAVYSGFAGPATGADHQQLRRAFTSLIGELMSE
ncbi:MAG: TlpA family protein disulfide reductase [Phycisphaerae bacterium]|nr:TlpA family protein disulfide reductase [Phycisphaerae bacterium]